MDISAIEKVLCKKAYDAGLVIDHLILDSGRYIRCKSLRSNIENNKDGSYKAGFTRDKKGIYLVAYDWHIGPAPILKEVECNGDLSQEEDAELQLEIEEILDKEREIQEQKYIHARKRAEKLIKTYVKADLNHPYLKKKGFNDVMLQYGDIRIDHYFNRIVIPVYNEDIESKEIYISTLQYIHGDGAKRFLAGGQKKYGHFFFHKHEGVDDNTILVCEGLATGASLNYATGLKTIVCFDCSNLVSVCDKLHTVIKGNKVKKDVIVCADNDISHPSKNVGLEKALYASKTYCFRIAICPALNNNSTDFNDFYIEKGAEPIKEIIFNARYFTSLEEITSKDILRAAYGKDQYRADLYANIFKNKFMYNKEIEDWMAFKGHRWEIDKESNWMASFDLLEKLFIEESYKKTKELEEYRKANGGSDWLVEVKEESEMTEEERKKKRKKDAKEKAFEDQIKTLQSASYQVQCTSTRKNIALQARSGENRLIDSSGDWDMTSYVLPVGNGIIDLKTGKLRRGVPTDRLSLGSNTIYRKDAECPLWHKFLNEILDNDHELIDFVHRYIGYSLCKDPKEQKFCIFYGPRGRNGKGVMIDTLSYVLGPYCKSKATKILMNNGGKESTESASPEMYDFKGRALFVASEVGEHSKFNLERIKSLTGQDEISCRPLYSKHIVRFRPTHSLILLCNNLPRASAYDEAFWERCITVLFPMHYTTSDNIKDKLHDRILDPDLKKRLRKEASGILNWCIDGALKWQKDGLKIPEKCMEERNKYRSDNDLIGNFIEDCTVQGSSVKDDSGEDVYFAYCEWKVTEGIKSIATRKTFTSNMESAGYSSYKTNGVRKYKGIVLNNEGKTFASKWRDKLQYQR